MEDTFLELLEVCRQKELYCMHNDNFRVIHKKSYISLNNTFQISLVNAIAPVLPTEEPEYSLSMGYENLSTISETKSNEVIKSSVKNFVPIQSEYEGIFNNTCDLPVCEDSSTFDVLKDHSEILSDSNNDDTSSDDDAFEDIKYIEASLVSLEENNDSSSSFPIFEKSDNSLSYLDNSLPEFETFSDHMKKTRSGSTTAHANNSLPKYDSFCFKIEPDQGRLTSFVKNDISDNSTNCPHLEAVDLFLISDISIPPGIENIDYDSEGDIYFLEELLSDASISLPENESSKFDHHDDPSFPLPPPEPPDVEVFFDFDPDSGELISAMMNNIDELIEDEFFDSRGGVDMSKITKKRPKPDKNEHEIVKSIQKPDL
nr:hypothetical protein [Tanacetum cinerariifolium]